MLRLDLKLGHWRKPDDLCKRTFNDLTGTLLDGQQFPLRSKDPMRLMSEASRGAM